AAEEEARKRAEESGVASAEPVAAPAADAPAAREAERPRPERAKEPTADADGHNRHKPRHGSHRMREEGASEEGGARYFGNELHLSREGAARRTGRKRPKTRVVEQSRSGSAHAFSRPTAPVVREIAVGETITVADLASRLAVKGADVVKALFKMGVMVTIN